MNIKNLRGWIKMSVPMLAMVASSMFYTSCDKENPGPGPGPGPVPTEKADTLYYENMTNLTKLSEISTKLAEREKRLIIASFEKNAKITVNKNDLNEVLRLGDLAGESRVRFAGQNATLVPGEKNMNLSDTECKAFVAIWKFIHFGPADNGLRFYITSAQESIFTLGEQKTNLFYSDAKKYNITNAKDFDGMATEAIEFAAKGQKVLIELTGKWNIDAEELVVLRKVLGNANIGVVNEADIVAKTSKHPTSAYVLNSPYGLAGNRIKLQISKNADAHKGETALMANDTTLWNLRTKDTESKTTAVLDVVDGNLQLATPIVGLYTNFDVNRGYDSHETSIDGKPVQRMEFQQLGADGLKILFGSLDKVNAGISGPSRNYLAPYVQGTVTVKLPNADRYYGKYATPDGAVNAINLNYADMRAFDTEFLEYPSVPNFHLLMSSADRIEFIGASDVAVMIPEGYRWEIWDQTGATSVSTLMIKKLGENRVFFPKSYLFSNYQEFLTGELFPLTAKKMSETKSATR